MNNGTLPLVCWPGKPRFGIFQQVDTIELDYPCAADPAQFKLLIEPANRGTHVVPGMPTQSTEVQTVLATHITSQSEPLRYVHAMERIYASPF